MAIALKLSQQIDAEINKGEIRLSGLQTLPYDEAVIVYENYIRILPNIETRLVNVGIAIINKAGGVIREDGLSFPGKMPETPEEVKEQCRLSLEAWDAYLDIRPILFPHTAPKNDCFREIDIHPINGKMIKAQLKDMEITVLFPPDLTDDELSLAKEIIEEFPPNLDDFKEGGR